MMTPKTREEWKKEFPNLSALFAIYLGPGWLGDTIPEMIISYYEYFEIEYAKSNIREIDEFIALTKARKIDPYQFFKAMESMRPLDNMTTVDWLKDIRSIIVENYKKVTGKGIE